MDDEILITGKNVFKDEIRSLEIVCSMLGDDFVGAVKTILERNGRVVVTGIGKSGRIGEKISATLSSVGTPSVFIHSTEAIHGDMGILSETDVIIAISYSGETEEVLRVVDFVDKKIPIISITGNTSSTLSKNSDFHLNINIEKEACPLNLAPTSSTTATLVMGDALAITLMNQKNFKDFDYAKYHPGGRLGRRLLCLVENEMFTKDLPTVSKDETVLNVLPTMSSGKMGLVVILNENDRIVGIFTDGDLRRLIESNSNFISKRIEDVMTKKPITIHPKVKIYDAEHLMKEKKITSLLVEENHRLVGVLQIFSIE